MIGGLGLRKMNFFYIFSVLVALMVIVAGGYGLYHPDLYSNAEQDFLRLLFNQDFVILVIFVPLLLISTWMIAQGSIRGEFLWFGTIGYLCYVYTGYSFGCVSAKLFLLHMAIAAFTFFLFLVKLALLDIETIRLRFKVTSFSFTAFFMIVIALLIEILWLQSYTIFFPEPVLAFSLLDLNMVLAVKVLDLTFLGPLCFLAGFWLYARKAIGYALTGILLVMIPAKFGTMITDFDIIISFTQTNCIFSLLALVALILLINFLKTIKEEKLTSYHERISSNF
jgi:hypothetical protein